MDSDVIHFIYLQAVRFYLDTTPERDYRRLFAAARFVGSFEPLISPAKKAAGVDPAAFVDSWLPNLRNFFLTATSEVLSFFQQLTSVSTS